MHILRVWAEWMVLGTVVMGMLGCLGGSEDPQSLLNQNINTTVVECAEDTECTFENIPTCQVPSCVAGRCVLSNAEEGLVCNNADDTCAPGRCNAQGACTLTPDDGLCDNGIFCDGRETCSPQDPSADARGCIAGPALVLDDEVECTVGSCDEERDTIVQDCTACACCGDDTDACGETPNCFNWACSAAYSCLLEPLPKGTACDDGAACTVGDICDANQTCTGEEEPGFCDDGIYCNGTEWCGPGAQNADGNGCVQEPRRIDDGLECTVDTCDEERQVVFHDTSQCACLSDLDCQSICATGRCDPNNRCIITPLEEGAPCDDGFACTTNDTCTAEQRCVGQPNDALCTPDGCTEVLQCDPSSTIAGDDGCIQLPGSVCGGQVLWLDASDDLERTVERQSSRLLGVDQPPEDALELAFARRESAAPRPGELFIYDILFHGAYATAPTVLLASTDASNQEGNTFEIAIGNVTAQGFEMVVYRTDQQGAEFERGPNPIAWSTDESLLVRNWPDRSGQGFDAQQDEPKAQPTLLEEEGRQLIRFRNDWLDFTRPITNDFTIVVVFRSFDGRNGHQWWDCPALIGGEIRGMQRDMTLVLCNGRVGWGANDGGFDFLTGTQREYNDGQLHVLLMTRSQETGNLTLRIDGDERITGVGVTGPLDENPFLRLARHPSGSGAHDVDYGEIMLFNRLLSDEELIGLEEVLLARWL